MGNFSQLDFLHASEAGKRLLAQQKRKFQVNLKCLKKCDDFWKQILERNVILKLFFYCWKPKPLKMKEVQVMHKQNFSFTVKWQDLLLTFNLGRGAKIRYLHNSVLSFSQFSSYYYIINYSKENTGKPYNHGTYLLFILEKWEIPSIYCFMYFHNPIKK